MILREAAHPASRRLRSSPGRRRSAQAPGPTRSKAPPRSSISLANRSPARAGRPTHKRQILESRVQATRSPRRRHSCRARRPRAFVSGSAVGYYGPHGDETITEEQSAGADFLAKVCEHGNRKPPASATPRASSASARASCSTVMAALCRRCSRRSNLAQAARSDLGANTGRGFTAR